MKELELHHFRCLVGLAEELNFGRAAARLHMSQPPLTRIVAEVERFLGARLFERTTRRVSLTPVGEVFVAEARVLLARADAALENVRAAVRRQGGRLRLAYTPLALQTVLPQILSSLREREHEVSIDLVEMPAPAQGEALRKGHVDMGFADAPYDEAESEAGTPGFTSLLIHREALAVVVPHSHPLSGRRSLRLEDLVEETIILHARHECPRDYDRIVEACRTAGFEPRVHPREAGQNCAALVAAGVGILLAPASPPSSAAPGFRRIPLENPRLCCEVWAVFPASGGTAQLDTLRQLVEGQGGLTRAEGSC
ncbi:MAG: LysR substrate-binding domain-containing protein [Armatimonadota bacterium]